MIERVVAVRAEQGHLAEAEVIQFAILHGFHLDKRDSAVLDAYRKSEWEVAPFGTSTFVTSETVDIRKEIHRRFGLLYRAEAYLNSIQPHGLVYRWWEGSYVGMKPNA